MRTAINTDNRIRIRSGKDRLEIRIPLKKNRALLAGMLLATAAWCFALFVSIKLVLGVQTFWIKAGILLSIGGWFLIGMAGASVFMWMFFGRERIVVTKEFFITDKPLIFFYRRSFYDNELLRQLRSDIEIYKVHRNNQWVDEQRTVLKFDTPGKTAIFARGIDPGQAEYILLEIARSGYLQASQFALEQKF
jgi:hypothetical protein